MKRKVSVILPTYNREATLGRAIESVLNQTYTDFELIIVDDGSTDNTRQLVENIHDDRITYYYVKINSGAAAARNYGIERAEGEYIAFQDSDDYWHSDKLEKQMKVMESNPDIGFVYHPISCRIDSDCCVILPPESLPIEKKQGDIYTQLLYDNMVDCPTLLVKKSCLNTCGYFDISLKALEDYDLALRLGKKYMAGFVDEPLIDSMYSTSGVSGNPTNYLVSSCIILGKYKNDYLATDTFNHRVEIILRDAKRCNVTDQIVNMLELVLKG